jgi:hypothetical protein
LGIHAAKHRYASIDIDSSLRRVCERTKKQRGRSGGGSRIALWAAGKVCCASGLRSQHRLPSQLGNGMPLDLADALCGDSPDRADIGKLCLTAVNESIPAAYDVGRTLI